MMSTVSGLQQAKSSLLSVTNIISGQHSKKIALPSNASGSARVCADTFLVPFTAPVTHEHMADSLSKVSKVSTMTKMLGMPCALPIYISPCALARLGHPDGEMNLVRAAGRTNIFQGVSNTLAMLCFFIRSLFPL
jgi:hypothetical protein